MMFDFFHRSLRNKLLVTFLAVGFLPFLTLLIYTLFLSQTKIVNKIVVEQSDRAQVVVKLINNNLLTLKNEVKFISSLDLMDDILAEDIDKRIARLLAQKASDLGSNNILLVTNTKGVVISSSSTKQSEEKMFNVQELSNKDNAEYIKGNTLYLYSKITSSFDKKRALGFLILEYNLNNLDIYLTHQNSIHSYIINPKSDLHIGEDLSLPLDFKQKNDNVINNQYVIVYQKIPTVMEGWYIVYAVDKSVALTFFYDFVRFMLYISIVIFIFVIYLSLKISKGVVKPIEELTRTTDDIISTHNYTTQLEIHTQDEIAILTHSFNNMLKVTSLALDKLEEENRLRLKRFIQLIETFNTIIQTKTENECIETSIKQIKLLTNKSDLQFQKESLKHTDNEHISLHVTNFEDNSTLYFGAIDLGFEEYTDKNEQNFYNSIANMIILQLDRIRLINKTMSASHAKSAFISNMSHELRTPLNAIIGFSQYMITYEELDDDQKEVMLNIESSAHYLLEMINEILDIAKIEAGKMQAHPEETDVLELVHGCFKMLQPLAIDKGLEFHLSSEKFQNKIYMTDPKMFKQIVLNLISNAIKFTKEGFVNLELSNDEKGLLFEVSDSGIGISEENIDQLFNDFTQVENVMQKQHKGTGLGLSLSKKLSHILGGDVTLMSDGTEQGTTASFTL